MAKKNDRRLMAGEYLHGYAQVSEALGVSEITLRRWCAAVDLRLPRWSGGQTDTIYLPKCYVLVLAHRLFRTKGMFGSAKRLKILENVHSWSVRSGVEQFCYEKVGEEDNEWEDWEV